ncbi:MAG: DtxR family transcriptional regulator [Hyphomonadaceae bacterium]|nr:DtxR family transcriptional regulator [Clostridia bacterium]
MDEIKKFHTVRGYQLLEQNKTQLTSGMEDYLEMIYRHVQGEGYIRINTLSELLNVQASSASKMVQKLNALGLLHYQKYGIIFLTESGMQIGAFLLSRHHVVEKFLKLIGVTDSILFETELIEHTITVDTLQKLDKLNRFFLKNPDIQLKFEEFIIN